MDLLSISVFLTFLGVVMTLFCDVNRNNCLRILYKIHFFLFTIRLGLHFVLKSKLTLFSKKQTSIENPPGQIYNKIGKIIFSKKTFEKDIEPSIVMMQEEIYEAIQDNASKITFLSIKTRFFFIFMTKIGINLPLVKELFDIVVNKIAK